MKILAAAVEWNEKYSNMPNLKILVDHIPTLQDYRFEQKGSIYYAELDGHVCFYYYKSPGEGFGGRTYTLNMKDGTTKDLVGPWSSNSSSVNQTGFGPCAEIIATTDPTVWQQGFTFMAHNITLDKLKEAAKLCGVHILKDPKLGFFVPSLNENKLVAIKERSGKVGLHEYDETGRWIPCET